MKKLRAVKEVVIMFFILFFSLTLILSICLMLRNNAVHKEGHRVLQKIYDASVEDIDNEKDWRWMCEEFDKVSYYRMIFKFWKPVDSFYKHIIEKL